MNGLIQASYGHTHAIAGGAVKTSARAHSPAQSEALAAQERSGKLAVNSSRDALALQHENETRVKATRQGNQVQNSAKADSDEDRLLKDVDDRASHETPIAPASSRKEHDTRPDDQTADDQNGTDSLKKDLATETPVEPTVTGKPDAIYRTLQSGDREARGSQLSVAA